MDLQLSFLVRSEAEMERAASVFAVHSRPPLCIGLQGDLGSGKTVFCRGYIHACGCQGTVRSPSYTLVEAYSGKKFCIYHFDFYRLSRLSEFEALGGRDYEDGSSVCLFEWANRLASIRTDLNLAIEVLNTRRRLNFRAHSLIGENLLRSVLQPLALITPECLADHGSRY